MPPGTLHGDSSVEDAAVRAPLLKPDQEMGVQGALTGTEQSVGRGGEASADRSSRQAGRRRDAATYAQDEEPQDRLRGVEEAELDLRAEAEPEAGSEARAKARAEAEPEARAEATGGRRGWSASTGASMALVARHPEVYEPCEDSFALVDALLAEQARLRARAPRLCVEVGCGSGYVITSLALLLGADDGSGSGGGSSRSRRGGGSGSGSGSHRDRSGCGRSRGSSGGGDGGGSGASGSGDSGGGDYSNGGGGGGGGCQFLATDMSPDAAETTTRTLAAHGVAADVVVTDLVRGLEGRLGGAVDVLVFNPPYVPTPEDEVGAPGVTAAWAGGARGRRVIDRLLPLVDGLLSPAGWLYLVTLTANDPPEICREMKRQGFESRIVIQRYTEEESLHILKFWREEEERPRPEDAAASSGGSAFRLSKLAFWRSSSSPSSPS